MARQFSLPQNFKVVQLFAPKTTNASLTSQVFTLKGAARAWVVLEFTQAVGHATTPTLNQATSIAAGTNKAGPTVDIWANEDTAATDTLVKQTAGASYAVTNNIKNKTVIFEIDPSRFDVANGYDCAYITIATSSQATNFVSGAVYLQTSFQQATPPSAILD
jgi:hypothetical protein